MRRSIQPRVSNSTCSEGIKVWSNQRAALRRWRNNGGTWTLLETAFTSYFLRKISWVIGKSFLAVSTFVYKELAHSLVNKLNNVNVIIWKFPKHRGPHKTPSRATCGRRAACLRPLIKPYTHTYKAFYSCGARNNSTNEACSPQPFSRRFISAIVKPWHISYAWSKKCCSNVISLAAE